MTVSESSTHRVALIQNPALGAILLWRFGIAYQMGSKKSSVPLPLFFLVLPILFNDDCLELVRTTFPSSGLPQLVSKLSKHQENILAIHTRALDMRSLTFQSIASGIASKLFELDYSNAALTTHPDKLPTVAKSLEKQTKGADKLGLWFSRLPDPHIFSLLRVEP